MPASALQRVEVTPTARRSTTTDPAVPLCAGTVPRPRGDRRRLTRASRCAPLAAPAASSTPVAPSTDKGNVRPFGLPRPIVHEFILSKYPPPCARDRLLDRDRDLRSDLADAPGHPRVPRRRIAGDCRQYVVHRRERARDRTGGDRAAGRAD